MNKKSKTLHEVFADDKDHILKRDNETSEAYERERLVWKELAETEKYVEALKKDIRSWEKSLDALIDKELYEDTETEDLIGEIERLSHEMFAINI